MVNSRLIVLVKRRNNVKIEGGGMNGSGVDGSELDIKTIDIGRPRTTEGVRVDIITSEFRIPILLNFYLIKAILLRLIMYQSQQIK